MAGATPIATPIATTPAQITPEWLNRVFADIGHDVVVGRVVTRSIGTGQSAHSERVSIYYARWDGNAPKSLVAKLPHPDPTSRATGHVHGSYARETNFYRLIAPTVKIHTPRCHYAAIDPANSDFVLLLEDLAPARQGDQMNGCSLAVAQCAMREIAGLHGPRWGDPKLLDHHFLAGAAAQGKVGRELFEPFWAGFLSRYRDRLTDELVRVGEGLVKHYDTYVRTYPGARCATHGDYRLDNVLITEADGTVRLAVVDWQTAGVGCGASDVAYFLGAGLLPDERRKHERELLRVYHDALAAYGVRDYPFETLWRDYTWYSYAGYVMAIVASILVVQTQRGDDMFMTMAQRHGQHIIDLDAERLLATA